MDDTKLFAQDCADFFKKRLFTPNLKPEDLSRRIDAAVYIMAQNWLSGLPRVPGIGEFVMGTKGPVGPHHLVELLHYLQNRDLQDDFLKAMPH
jgi:hypothetical protein